MCDGKLCPSCEYERIRRKDLKDKIESLVLCFHVGAKEEEFLAMKDELISLIKNID